MMQHKCQPNAAPCKKSHCICVSISILPCNSLPQKQGSYSSSATHSLLDIVIEHAHNLSILQSLRRHNTKLPPSVTPPWCKHCYSARYSHHHGHSRSMNDTWAVLRLSLQTCTQSAMLPSAAFTHTQDQEGTCSMCCMTSRPWALWNKAGRLSSVALLRLVIQVLLSLFSIRQTTQAAPCDAVCLACIVQISLAAIAMHASVIHSLISSPRARCVQS